MSLPLPYKYLESEKGPKMLLEAIKLYGTVELPGAANNSVILGWAEEVGAKSYYSADSIPWCGLFMAVVAKRAEKDLPKDPLRALNWLKFGNEAPEAMLGDVLVFDRGNGFGHVSLYVGEDATCYHGLGGNQSDKVCIVRLQKNRLKGVRRPKYNFQPLNIRKIILDDHGEISHNEQ